MRKVLVALGGNALEPENGNPTPEGQLEAVKVAVANIADLIEQGNEVIVTHGNGPQVGRVLLQNEAGKEITPPQPLDVCGAMTQGAIGYSIQNALKTELKNRGINKQVVSLVTQVEVLESDPAFNNPTKPIGPFYTKEQVEVLSKGKDYVFKEDSGRGWRRVVASPKPHNAIEWEAANLLINAGVVVIVAGGGGIPVVSDGMNGYKGIEAVIDKDLSAALLAEQLKADDLFILTAVDKVALNFGKPNQELLSKINITSAKQYCEEGHFAAGSMLPKVEAAIKFLEKNPKSRAIITSLEKAKLAFEEKDGTVIIF